MTYTYVKYAHPTFGDVIVAYAGLVPVALQWSDRHRDPRTGYMIRKKQPVVSDAYIRIEPARFFVIIDDARYVDANVFDSLWQREQRETEIDHAVGNLTHWFHREEHKITAPAVWALVTTDEPSRPEPAPVILTGAPPKTKRKSKVFEDAILKRELKELGETL